MPFRLTKSRRIEILSGSAGVLYGDQAVRWRDQFVTKSPENTGGSVQLSGGSFDTYEGRGDVSGAINKDWRYFFTGSYNQGDNYRKHNANETGSILVAFNIKRPQIRSLFETSYYDDDRENPGSLEKNSLKNPRYSGNDKRIFHEMTTAARTGYQHQLNQNWALAADLDYSDTLVSFH